MNYATLKLTQLKEIAAERGISPAGDKRKKATWVAALEGASAVQPAPAPAVIKPRRYTLNTANAALAGTGYTIVHNTKYAANKTNEHRLGWYEVFADDKRRYTNRTLSNVVAWVYAAIEHEARCLRILAGTEKVV